jgi:hypothetical protein
MFKVVFKVALTPGRKEKLSIAKAQGMQKALL